MGEPIKYQAPTKYHTATTTSIENNFSFNLAYAGSKIGSNELGGDAKFNGIDLGFVGTQDNLSAGIGYTYQNASDWKYSELYSKFGYRLFNQNNNYGIASLGVGYAWGTAKEFAVDLEYFTVPFELEIGHYFQPNLALYGALGYKWLWNTHAEACIMGICGSGSSSELDIDGVTYKIGFKYNF